jgi:hypothetical protein
MKKDRFIRVADPEYAVTRSIPDTTQLFREYTVLDGQIDMNIELAGKAMQEGKFEKATAYALIAQAIQAERENLVRVAKGGWSA